MADIFERVSSSEKVSLQIASKGPIKKKTAFGAKPLPEPMLTFCKLDH